MGIINWIIGRSALPDEPEVGAVKETRRILEEYLDLPADKSHPKGVKNARAILKGLKATNKKLSRAIRIENAKHSTPKERKAALSIQVQESNKLFEIHQYFTRELNWIKGPKL